MGGRFGDGPVEPEPEEVKFHADWHPRALALTLAAGALGGWNLDQSRHAREGLAPRDYCRFSYYEKWIAALADLLVERGMVTEAELTGATPGPSALASRRLPADAVARTLAAVRPYTRAAGPAARFAVGDRVRTRARPFNAFVPGGHTRLPAYAAGTEGDILRLHGTHVFPDSNAHGLGEAAEPLYCVAFRAGDLWEAAEAPGDRVMLDLWQSYLEPA